MDPFEAGEEPAQIRAYAGQPDNRREFQVSGLFLKPDAFSHPSFTLSAKPL
jgi:hypothetical protein